MKPLPLVFCVLLALLGGCATQRADRRNLVPVTPAEAPSMRTYDPWERINRVSYRFNARFDEALSLPVAKAYRRTPLVLQAGVHNFFGNLAEINHTFNYVLQGRLRRGAGSLGRLVINSTAGLGGLLDVAKKTGLEPSSTGLGATLSQWGLHPGPYLVVPILGPSTLRDGMGTLGDFAFSYGVNPVGLYRGTDSWYFAATKGVDARAGISFRYYATGSPFEYETVRFFYVHRRLIEDTAVQHVVPAN
jgi:phospholipid-binding lipoprotein MlaA